jgi:hypothetical protein
VLPSPITAAGAHEDDVASRDDHARVGSFAHVEREPLSLP